MSTGYNVNYTVGPVNIKLPCLQTDNHPYWKNHIYEKKIISKCDGVFLQFE